MAAPTHCTTTYAITDIPILLINYLHPLLLIADWIREQLV